jgi:hypothetical protein
MWVYARQRKCQWGSFFEFLLVYDGVYLVLPRSELPRFATRVVSTTTRGDIVYCLTNSEASGAPALRQLQDIKTHGAWVASNDLAKRGGVASYYGVHIHPDLSFESFDLRVLYTFDTPCRYVNEPFVVYHGTDKSSVKSILKEGLRPSFGMLGMAVYFGSFWKAFRFATLTQDYKKRHGAILRCYAHWLSITWKPVYSSEWCACSLCASAINKDFNADHDGKWKHFADAVMAFPRPGHSIKNEEFASKDASLVYIESVGHAVSETEHHEPLNRTLAIE